VKPGIEQGILAGNIMKEAKKANLIDPDFYDAVAFVGVFKANYPQGFPEFDEAYKDLDKALELQAKMTWEDRFCDIYIAYTKWYFNQKKYDEALAKAQAGLDKDARNQDLIDWKKKIEDAKK
jgi:tetratricopeptide (TPR) repeat protein